MHECRPVPPSGSGIRGYGQYLVPACVAALTAAWVFLFPRLWHAWFPGDQAQSALDHGAYFSHGPLALLLSIVAAWHVRRSYLIPTTDSSDAEAIRRERKDHAPTESATVTPAPGWIISLMLVAFAGVTLTGVTSGEIFFIGCGSLLLLATCCLSHGGFSMLHRYRFPIFWLLFAFPLPVAWTNWMNEFIKMKVAGAAVWLANFAFHVPVLQDGRLLFLQGPYPHDPHVMVVANVCGGLRSMLALTFIAALLTGICHLRSPAGWLILLAAPPIAILFNGIRFTALILLASNGYMESEESVRWMHMVTGLTVFAGSLIALIQFEYMLPRWSAMLHREWQGDPALDLRSIGRSFWKIRQRRRAIKTSRHRHQPHQLVASINAYAHTEQSE